MSIENLLTVGLAAAILVAAAILRLVVLGAVRLFFKLSGRQAPARETAPAPAAGRRPRRPVARPALHGLGELGAGLIFVLATLGTWMRSGGTLVARAVGTAYASAAPRVASGTDKGLAAAGQKLRSVAIVSVASAQHLGRVIAQRIKELNAERAARRAAAAPAREPSDARVIVLDREWDPLTDPLEDEPASNYS